MRQVFFCAEPLCRIWDVDKVDSLPPAGLSKPQKPLEFLALLGIDQPVAGE
jgi:hypothetical protein